ncbi:uncharacterized protein LOC9662521 [Selaginella moellendorffii]|nr:uncharacterized protein LOC9662521 [Selaginella moellendorffii]|eukprot:XP_002962202.2 uncharacterized protein LOC9662521 [Selaginella moellendorffii]
MAFLRRRLEGWKRGVKTLFFMTSMVGSLVLHSSTPLLLALLDVGIPCVILSTLDLEKRSSFGSYDFRSSLLDILIVSIARSFAIISAYALGGVRCEAYFMIAALLGLSSAALVAVKACLFFAVFSSSSSTPRRTPPAGSLWSSTTSSARFGVVMLFASSFACALGHGVSAYRTSCQAKKKSFPQGDEESNFFCKYIVKLRRGKRFRSTAIFHKLGKSDEDDEQSPLLVNSKFMLCKGLHLHFRLCEGWPRDQRSFRSKSLSRSASLPFPGSKPLFLSSSLSLPSKVSGWCDRGGEEHIVDIDPGDSSSKGIVLVHGFGGGVFSWRHVMAPLARQTGHSVAAFDRPGWGLTSRPGKNGGRDKDGLPNPYELQSQVDLLLSFCQKLKFSSVVLVGHDDGGLLALMAAAKILKSPSSTQVVIKGVVLIAVSSSREVISPFARVLLHTSLGRHILRPLLCSEMASRHAWHDASKLTSEVMELYKVPLRVDGWDRQALESQKFSSSSEQVTPELLLAVQNLPALLVAGMQDMLVPLQAVQDLASRLSKSKFIALPRCGHLPPEECPGALLAGLVPFIAEHLGRPSV